MTQFLSGLLVGAIIMDIAWRILGRVQAKLVEQQRLLICEQKAVIDFLVSQLVSS